VILRGRLGLLRLGQPPRWVWPVGVAVAVCLGGFALLSILLLRSLLADNIQFAAGRGDIDAVKRFLAEGVDVNATECDRNATALHLAAEGGRRDVAELLLDSGANVQLRDNMGFTALDLAVKNRHVALARLLLDHGADPNAAGSGGHTSLHWAARAGDLNCVELLLSRGAEVNPVAYSLTGRPSTPLDRAARHPDVARVLREAGGVSASELGRPATTRQ